VILVVVVILVVILVVVVVRLVVIVLWAFHSSCKQAAAGEPSSRPSVFLLPLKSSSLTASFLRFFSFPRHSVTSFLLTMPIITHVLHTLFLRHLSVMIM